MQVKSVVLTQISSRRYVSIWRFLWLKIVTDIFVNDILMIFSHVKLFFPTRLEILSC